MAIFIQFHLFRPQATYQFGTFVEDRITVQVMLDLIQYYKKFMQREEAQQSSTRNVSRKDSLGLQFMFFYIYFMQGIIFSISTTMPYIYQKLPAYQQMSLFFASLLPWSLKFFVAPILEKYTNMDYGKRKTWLIISKIISGFLLYLASNYTAYEQINTFAWILIAINFVMVFHNIASQSLSIKHFKNKQRIGVLQILGDYGGAAAGGLTMMKMTNTDFAQALGLESAITSPSTIIIGYSILLLSSIPPIHFWFRERRLKSEDVSQAKGICEIIQYNKVFFDFDSKYFRLAVFLLLYMQGINFYLAGYQYKLVDRGFSRNQYNTIQNLSMLVMIGITLFMEELQCFQGRVRSLSIIFIVSIANMIVMLTIFPLEPWGVSISVFLNEFIYAWRKYVIYQIVNNLPLHGVAGMFLTTLTSLNEFAEVKTIHSLIINLFGFQKCITFGLIYQIVFLLCLSRIFDWIEEGKVEIDAQILEKEEKYIQDDLSEQI